MFSRKRNKAEISDEQPTFHVRYVGVTETFLANGRGCTGQPLQRLWDNAPTEKHLRRVAIQLSLNGLVLKELDLPKKSKKLFPMEDISFCAADKSINDRLFCWICKQPVSGKLEAHAVLCSTSDKAQAMAAVLSRAFQLAYKDWRAERQREERRKLTKAVDLEAFELDEGLQSEGNSLNDSSQGSSPDVNFKSHLLHPR